jgi:D-serine deaminase-like pyridoxal phosphate-dependent protein
MSLSPDLPTLRDIATPALVVDEAVLDANIARMAGFARTGSVALRPHAKTHKSSEIARRQIAAGAAGICCATVAEVEAMAAAGIGGLLLTCPIGDATKAARIAALNRKAPLAVVVDHPAQVDLLQNAVGTDDPPLLVLVDVDVGQRRTGVVGAAAVLALAKRIRDQQTLSFGGLQGYAGHVQHIVDADERKAAAAAAGEQLQAMSFALQVEGLPCAIVSGSGTGASAYDTNGPYTELQAGSYVLMDADYRRIRTAEGGLPYAPALFVLASVVSAGRPGQFTVDAGVKSLAVNGPVPDILRGAPDGCRYQFSGDEHGTIMLPDGAAAPPIGTRLLIAATHCDPTVNLFSAYHFVGHNGGVRTVPVLGRH